MTIKKHIPNTITCCNLISGCIATAYAFGGNPELALLWIIIGAVFDFFDGMSARLLHVSSPIGKELDSLADDITFGVAPATIVFSELHVIDYPAFLEPLRDILPFFAFVMAAFYDLIIVFLFMFVMLVGMDFDAIVDSSETAREFGIRQTSLEDMVRRMAS